MKELAAIYRIFASGVAGFFQIYGFIWYTQLLQATRHALGLTRAPIVSGPRNDDKGCPACLIKLGRTFDTGHAVPRIEGLKPVMAVFGCMPAQHNNGLGSGHLLGL